MQNIKEISTDEIRLLLGNKEVKIIDVRTSDAYNGWRINGEVRGGHISGAKSLPFKWTNYLDWIEVVRSKQILPKHKLIIYGYELQQVERVAVNFTKAGYDNVFIYNGFIHEWSANSDLPMEKLARYKNLFMLGVLMRLVETFYQILFAQLHKEQQ